MRRRTRVSSRLGSKWMSRGALLEGVAQDVVEGLDHRRRGGVELRRRAGQELLVRRGRRCEMRLGVELLLRGLEAGLEVVEALVDRLDVGAGGHHALHVEAGHALDVSAGKGANGSWTATVICRVGLRDRDHAVLARERARRAPLVTTSRSRSSGLIFT